MHNQLWSALVVALRQKNKLTARQVAETAGIDPSYVTKIEREGLVPRRDKVEALAKALNAEADGLLIAAGYAPKSLSQRSLDCASLNELPMPKELVACVRDLAGLSWEHQCDAAHYLNIFLTSVASGKRKD